MGFEFLNKLPTPAEIKELFPLPAQYAAVKAARDQEAKDIITGQSSRFLVIIGPCSADNEDSVLDYASRLTALQEETKDKLLIIPRVYTNKPRTTGEGYKGMLHQPDPEKRPSMAEGLRAIRHLHMQVLMETGLSTADEMLYPDNVSYLDDIMSYIAVGARSVENQQHRLISSGCHVPVGMKNPTSGDLSVMLNSVQAAQHGHDFIMRDWEVKTQGNPWTHTILRGAVSKHGQCLPNYHYEDLILLHRLYMERSLQNPAVIVDANHSNSNKQFREQIRIVKEVLHSRRHSADLKDFIRGVMIESYIEEGCQKIGEGTYGKSITDPCLGWEDSRRLILEIAEGI
ncbi:MAG: 3-deoxy-7-phosphoheptulonate synthase [Lachnospiraceae bacterium]|nr:3-deoxy-7-phosphoheptulonate synthase [Lachnospiraceae bacterium]